MNLQALDIKNLPTPKEEAWKYTNLPGAVPKKLTPSTKNEDVVIHRSGGQKRGGPVDILFTGQNGILHTPRLSIVLEEGQEFTFIERHDGQGSYWKNMVSEITLAPNARLYHYRLQDDSSQGVQTSQVRITMGRDSTYDGFSLNMGGKLTRHDTHAVINGPNAHCSFNGINLLQGTQHGDTTILVEHQAPHCTSNQFYRSVLDENARGVFQGKIHVHKAAQKTDGYQLSNAILLSERAEMDTKPELEIYADDVKCSHGATTGQLDDEPLFYLRTRGLNLPEARLLLMQAFVDEIADTIYDDDFRKVIELKTNNWLRECLK